MKSTGHEIEAPSRLRVKTGIVSGQLLGDMVADPDYVAGLDRLAEAFARLTGRDRGNERQREFLNDILPSVLSRK